MTGALIEAQGLGKSYGVHRVLRGIDLAVAEREVVCVIGPSGSGKTTLLETVQEGQVLVQGRVVARPGSDAPTRRNARALRPEIGMVFQQFNLWPHMTVLGNIIEAPMRVRRMSRDAAVATAEALLAKVGLADKPDALLISALTLVFATIAGMLLAALSSSRMWIARAVATSFDEADPQHPDPGAAAVGLLRAAHPSRDPPASSACRSIRPPSSPRCSAPASRPCRSAIGRRRRCWGCRRCNRSSASWHRRRSAPCCRRWPRISSS